MTKVLVVGAGSIGERHARCFLAAGASVSVCEPREERRAILKQQYKFDQLYASFDAVPLKEFQAVVVCVPAHLHVDVAIKALQAGCHVLVEKPLALTSDDARRLLEFAAKTDRVTGVAYVYRHIPAARRVHERILAGEIGTIRSIVCVSGQEFPRYRPDYREIYYRSHKTGGGSIHDALTHVANFVQWCIGTDQFVWARGDHLVLPGVEVEDTATIVLRTPGQRMVSLNLNQFQKNNDGFMEFAGELGTIRLVVNGWKVGLFKNDEWTWEEFPLERDDMFVAQARNFLAAIDGKEKMTCPLSEGFETLRTIESAHKSWQTGQEIKVR